MENNKQQRLTVDEALELIEKRLGMILVPVDLTEQIAMPLFSARKDIRTCIDAIRNPVPAEEVEGSPSDE